ncbi:MAG: hypothetical protein IPO93_14625 [Actinobacteria bacterium]|nr:hypothetical protein [Actinomycetota bacterium]
MTPQTTARIAAAIFAAVAAFQVLVALGAPWGAFTQGGGTDGALPVVGRGIAAVSALIVLVMAGAMLARAGLGPFRSAPRVVITVLAWLTTIYSGLAVIVNIITPSVPERAVWAPVSIVLFVLVVLTMAKTRSAAAQEAS